jgi:glycine cleavage system H protein
MTNPTDLKYAETHEWARSAGGVVTVGITGFAADALSDITYVDLPRVGERIRAGERFGEIESVKAVSDLMAPVTGQVTAVNEALNDDPTVIAKDPYGAGWMIQVRPDQPAELDRLLSAADYEKHTAEAGH